MFYNLHSGNERLAEARTDLLAKEQQNQFPSTAPRRPVLEPPCVGSLKTNLLLSGNPAPRENVEIPKSTAQASNDGSPEAHCTEVSYVSFFPWGSDVFLCYFFDIILVLFCLIYALG